MRQFLIGALALLFVSTAVWALDEVTTGVPRNETKNWVVTGQNFKDLQDTAISLSLSDVSTAASGYTIAPYACTIIRWYSVLDSGIDSNTTLTLYVQVSPNTTGTEVNLNLDPAGSRGNGDAGRIIHSAADSPYGARKFVDISGSNTVAAGDVIAFDSDGGTTAPARSDVTVVCRR